MSAASKVASITTFIKQIKNIESRKEHTLFYRGHSDAAYEPLPSVFRKIENDGSTGTYADQEDCLFKDMIMQCPQDFIGCSSTLEYLVKMQHYGLPTRLLDLTSNPLVALYFACCSHQSKGGKDGQVIVYEVPDKEIKFFNSDTVAVIGNLAKMPRDFDYNRESDNLSFMHQIKTEKPYFVDLIEVKDLTSVQCVKVKLDNRRVTQQSGAFFIFGMGKSITQPAEIPYRYICKRDNAPIFIDIMQRGKKEMLAELAELSISEASLFPEIDRVARHLKNQVVEAL